MFKGSDVLPSNASALQQVLADLDWARIGALDTEVVRRVVDPATCPLALLPWLAWSVSVDVFDENWPEATQRAVIAAAPELHRIKGTRLAVRMALDALGHDSYLREWFEEAPAAKRGSFVVGLILNERLEALTLERQVQIRAAVRRAKPKSRTFTLEAAGTIDGAAYAGGVMQGAMFVTIAPEA